MKIKLILLIFVLFNLSYLEANAVCTRSDFNNNEEYSSYLNWEWECNGEKIYSDVTEKADDIWKEYEVISKTRNDIKNQKNELETQKELLNQIEEASRWEWAYADLNPQTRQDVIDTLYADYEANWWDANWWIWSNNIKEARQDLVDREADLNNKERKLQTNQQNLDNEAINLWKDVEQLSDNIDEWNQDIKNNVTDWTHNENALKDIEWDINKLEWVEWKLEETEWKLEEVNNNYNRVNDAYNNADEGYNEANKKLNELNTDLEDAINNWASVEEIENLKTEIFNTEIEKNAQELKKSVEWKKKQKAEAEKQKAEAEKQKAEAEKQKLDELKDREKRVKEEVKRCENDPENCTKVYSDKQIKEVKEKIKKAKESAAQEVIDKEIVKVNTECSKWDTVACREAIVEMNKAETNKACIDSVSQACKDAKDVKNISDDVANDYKKKASNAAAQKEIVKAENKVKVECSKWDSLACREAISEMNNAEAIKSCIDPNSSACSEAWDIANMTAWIVEQTKANIAANPWLKTLGSSSTMDALLWITWKSSIINWDDNTEEGGFTTLTKLVIWFKDSLTWLVQLLAVWAFLFVWIRLGMARWNPEEFKKALQHMIYVIVWIFVISISWAAVVLVAWISI